jgi:hypothetical protein
MSGVSEVWRMWRSDSSFETAVAVGAVVAWAGVTYWKMNDESGGSTGANRLNR